MKCIQCNTDNKLKERISNSGRCKNCRHSFVLGATARPNPHNLTDLFFQQTLTRLSANGTLSFTRQQLFYYLNRRLQPGAFSIWRGRQTPRSWRGRQTSRLRDPRPPSYLISVLIFLLGSLLIVIASAAFLHVGLGLGILLLGGGFFPVYVSLANVRRKWQLRHVPPPPPPPLPGPDIKRFTIDTHRFSDILTRWESVNGRIPLLTTVQPRSQTASSTIDPDLTLYSFDRVLVCDNDAIAQFFIANNFHFERNCPVISINGYPQNIFTTLLDMLRRNPELKVYVLHNADPKGMSLAHKLHTDPDWFGNSTAQIYDLGLSPQQVFPNRKMFVKRSYELTASARQQIPEAIHQTLTADELRWLVDGSYVELESFLPRTLLQIVMRDMASSRRIQPSNPEHQTATSSGDSSWEAADY